MARNNRISQRRFGIIQRNLRRGITLFEVVLALSILVGAFAAISQILSIGGRAAAQAQLTSEAIMRCERQMNEVIAGVLPMTAMQRTPFEDDPKWLWTLNVSESNTPNLLLVEVIVEREGSRSDASTNFRLTRMVRDPQIFLDAESAESGGTTQ